MTENKLYLKGNKMRYDPELCLLMQLRELIEVFENTYKIPPKTLLIGDQELKAIKRYFDNTVGLIDTRLQDEFENGYLLGLEIEETYNENNFYLL